MKERRASLTSKRKSESPKAKRKTPAKKSPKKKGSPKPTTRKNSQQVPKKKTVSKSSSAVKPSRVNTKSATATAIRSSTQQGLSIMGISPSVGCTEARQVREVSERQSHSITQLNVEVLNALPAHIALVDTKGVIRFVNKAWQRFATANKLKAENFGVGSNYITVCEQAPGDCAEKAQQVAEGLQATLAGEQERFSLEYPCHASHEQRWFKVLVTPISDTGNFGAVVMHFNISEQRCIQDELEKEQQFISKILDTAGALVVVLDSDWRILRFNRVCEQLTGRTLKDMRGKSFLDLAVVSGEDALEVKNLLGSFRNGEFPESFESAWLDNDRRVRWIKWSNTVITGEEGEMENIIATGIDITSRKQAEQEVERLLRHNTLILNSAGDGIYGIDKNGQATFFNHAAEQLTGWEWQDVNGQIIHALLHHTREDGTPYPWEACPVYSSITKGKYHQEDLEILWRKDGTSFPVSYTSAPIWTERNKIEGAVVTFKDITERKKSDEALRESEERFKAFMNHSPTVAFLKNEKGQYVYVNEQWEHKLHLPMAECLGKTDQQLFPPEVVRSFKEHDQEALKTREVLETEETTFDEKGRLRYWWVMKFPVQSKDGHCLLGGVALDITFRKHAEKALQQREATLQENKKELQALGGQLISAQEDERRRISRELHDDMNQRLAVLALNIQSAQKGMDRASPTYGVFQKLFDGVSSLSDDVRHLAYQLHPSILDDLGLNVALRTFIDDFSKYEGIPVVFVSIELPGSLSPEIASCLYRVTQECLRNVSRHSRASQAEVSIIIEDKGLRLSHPR